MLEFARFSKLLISAALTNKYPKSALKKPPPYRFKPAVLLRPFRAPAVLVLKNISERPGR
jgi:hypothetical protein